MAMDDRYNRSDFGRQERYQDFDHRDRGRYQDDMMMDRRDNSRGMGGNRDGQVGGCPKCILFLSFYGTAAQTHQRDPQLKSFQFRTYCGWGKRVEFYPSSLGSTSLTEETDTAETAGIPGAEASTNA